MQEGTGIVHIAPGCGAEDFELGRAHGLPVLHAGRRVGPVLPRVRLAGRDARPSEAAERIIGDLREQRRARRARAPSRTAIPSAGAATRRSSSASPTTGSSPSARSASRCERRTARSSGRPPTWASAWTTGCVNMADWNISRRRYYGLPLPFYPCGCGQLNVIGSRAELGERATTALDGLEELRRPWIDAVKIRCAACGGRGRAGSPRSVTSGSTPASCRSRRSAGRTRPGVPAGYATGAANGLTTADLPDHAYWEKWFPADWVSEMREQIRLWFYSQLFMSVALTGRAPYRRVLGYEKMLDEHGREMHGSWGNMIDAEEAFAADGRRRHALAVLHAAAQPEPALRLRARRTRSSASCSRFWNSVTFFVHYANIAGFSPAVDDLERRTPPGRSRSTGGCRADARSSSPSGRAAYESYLAGRRDARLRGLSRRPLELVHPALAAAVLERRRRRRCRRSGPRLSRRCESSRRSLPFLADHLWQILVVGSEPDAPARSSWPAGRRPPTPDERLLAEIAEVRQVVELGRQARSSSRGSSCASRCAGSSSRASRASTATLAEIADELRVKRGRPRADRDDRAAGQAEPARARAAARQGRAAGRARRSTPVSSGSSTEAASRSPGTCSSRTRCWSSGSRSQAGRSRPTRA